MTVEDPCTPGFFTGDVVKHERANHPAFRAPGIEVFSLISL